jgi:hypothetical protein
LFKRGGNCSERISETDKKPLVGTGTGAQQKRNQVDSDKVVKHEEMQHVPQQAPDLACPNSVRLRANETEPRIQETAVSARSNRWWRATERPAEDSQWNTWDEKTGLIPEICSDIE